MEEHQVEPAPSRRGAQAATVAVDPGSGRRPYRPEGLDDAFRSPGGQPEEPPTLPTLGVIGWARWVWRQLTSMRVALLLLMLLAVAALPGSFFPQRPQAPERVIQYLEDNPTLGPWLDRLGFFDVYASGWFSAIYLLLFISLVGCILPRALAHLRALRADPPRVPRSFDRFPVREELVVDTSPEAAQRAALRALRGRYRARAGAEARAAGGATTLTIRAERGYLRETGNLLFHLALVGVLVGVALGGLFGYRGQVLVIEGRGFANAVVAYDSFDAGVWFQDQALEPFTLTLRQFGAEFDPLTLQPRDFAAAVAVTEPGAAQRAEVIKVNSPLRVGGARVYLVGNGYAPTVTVHDGDGEVAFAGPVPFLPQDSVYTSRGVIKVPDVSTGPQLGLVGFLLPTAVVEGEDARSVFPQPLSPLLVLTAYAGDLGLDDGVPQNVYELDTSAMTLVASQGVLDPSAPTDAEPLTLLLEPGQSLDLPDGLGTVTFDGLARFAALDLRHDPMIGAVLVFALLAMVGLGTSLFVPRRRMWVRLTAAPDGRTVVAAAALARGEDPGLRQDLDRVVDAVRLTSRENT